MGNRGSNGWGSPLRLKECILIFGIIILIPGIVLTAVDGMTIKWLGPLLLALAGLCLVIGVVLVIVDTNRKRSKKT